MRMSNLRNTLPPNLLCDQLEQKTKKKTKKRDKKHKPQNLSSAIFK